MALTIETVASALRAEEPDYPALAHMGPGLLPLLDQLIHGQDIELATKAASLAGFVQEAGAADVLGRAAISPLATVRVAAAYSAQHLEPVGRAHVLAMTLVDGDAGVRKVGLRSAAAAPTPAVNQLVQRLQLHEKVPHLLDLARSIAPRQ